MPFRKQTTGEYPITQDQIRIENPNTSYPAYFTEAVGYDWVNDTPQPTYNQKTQYVVEDYPQETDGVWNQVWLVKDYTPEQIAERQKQQDDNAKASNKSQAESLLQETDWTATVDINNPQYSNPYLANQDAFLAYRSQLRAIAVNPPVIVEVWPTKPDEVWTTV